MAKPTAAPRREETPPELLEAPRPASRPQAPAQVATFVGVVKRAEGWALAELELAADDPRLRIVHDRLPRTNALEMALVRHQRLFALESAARRGRKS